MAKQVSLVSPFGDVVLRLHSSHAHIEGGDPLAGDWALGWWHAHQAGDEAVFSRSFWRSELSADQRPSVGRTELDAFLRPWGFDAELSLETANLPAGMRSRVHAYVQGFNQARKRRGKETPWTPEDCHLLVRGLGFLEWWETRYPQMRHLIEAWQAGLSWAKVLDLWPGLGPEPDKQAWSTLEWPPAFSAEARELLGRVRRFRPASLFPVPASRSSSGRPLLAAAYTSDVTEPGLPFMAVRIDTAVGSVRGLSRPGHPGFLAGRTPELVWHATPAIDDGVDLRMVERHQGRGVSGWWAGAERTGTLQGLLTLEESDNAESAMARTQDLGSASLDFVAADAKGFVRWAQGPRWIRQSARDAWLPAAWGEKLSVTSRTLPEAPAFDRPGRTNLEALATLYSQPRAEWAEGVLATLRFLLPDTDVGHKLRRWSGSPGSPEAAEFERLYGTVVEAFWSSSPLVPLWDSPVSQSLTNAIESLIQVPHSAWLPSSEKNHRLADAVRRAFAPGRSPGPAILGRRSHKACWKEDHGGKPRIFATTVVVLADPGDQDWRVFHTDDETEPVVFNAW